MSRRNQWPIAAPRVAKVKTPAPIEPIWYLRSIGYGDYRQTNYWRRRRESFRAGFPHDECGLCGLSERDHVFRVAFHVHHLSYAHLGYEPDGDLALLCSACHNLVHRPESAAAQSWLRVREVENPDLAEAAKALLPLKPVDT